MESALAKPIKEPVNAVVAETPTKRKEKNKSVGGGRTCYMCGGAYPHQGTVPSEVCRLKGVRDTLPQVNTLIGFHDQVAGRLQNRQVQNDRMSQKRRALSCVPPLLLNERMDQNFPAQEGPSSESLMLPHDETEPSGGVSHGSVAGAEDSVTRKFIDDPSPTDIVKRRGGDRYTLRPRLSAPVRLQDYVCH
ncbi:hypothetical protein NDU88_004213 [Pleurodeles waltl]|uniref:Uncharacterized protein n=1 Tax=Pleurodeles waltl TaxID=8319 RepID=A0AAV7V0L8_PLEWA|nr:hypothetical protein NDU88_004213 [Pleurodeles waltl]